MEIIFESNGSTAEFKSWLQAYNAINESLLLEIDLKEQQFVAKTHTPEKTIVKFGKLSFEDASLAVKKIVGKELKEYSLDEWNAEVSNRIKIGIRGKLPMFIKVVEMFSTTDNHKIVVRFDVVEHNGATELLAQKVEFKSDSLNMVLNTDNLDEFKYISDEVFANHISYIANPLEFEIAPEVNKMVGTIAKTCTLPGNDKKDIIDFVCTRDENDEWVLRAVQHNGKAYNDPDGHAYDFKMAYMSHENSGVEVVVPIVRNNFLLGTSSDSESSVITLPNDAEVGRIKVASGNFITILASVRF